MATFLGDNTAQRINIGFGQLGGMSVEPGPRVPWCSEQSSADPVRAGREQPFDEAEGFVERGTARGFLFLRGGVLRGAGDGGAEGEDFIGKARVDGAGGDGVEVDGLVAELFGERFDETHHAGLGDAVGGKIDARFGGAAAGEGDDFSATRRAAE